MAYLIAKSRGKPAKAVSQVLQQWADMPSSPSVGEANNTNISQLISQAAQSRELLSLIRALLPAALAPHVRAGKLDAAGWTLMAPNGAAAAKLQQLRPELEQHLQARGVKVSAIRIRVQGAG